MSAIEIEVPLDVGLDNDSVSLAQLEVKILFGDTVLARDVMISCISSDEADSNHDIPRWPKYRDNGLPSKFLRPGEPGELQSLPSLIPPLGKERSLRIVLNSRRRKSWQNWAAILSRPTGAGVLAWYLPFGGSSE